MPLPNAVLRQYTPPTCTLEIMVGSSPQPRGVGLTATAPLNFILRFDDPRLISDPKSVQGDRYQLEALHQAVTTYVQNLLKSSEQFNVLPAPSSLDAPASPMESRLSHPDSASALSEEIAPIASAVASGKIFLQAADSSAIAHNLFLGSLKNNTSGSVIQLGVLQLFDLLTALEEYAADVVELPQRRLVASAPSNWAGIAAILLLVMGITTAVVLFLRPKSHRQIATTTVVQSPTNQQPSIQPSVTPLPLPSSFQQLPSPPTGVFIPSPNNKSAKGNIPQAATIPLNQPAGVFSPPAPSGILITPKQGASVNPSETNNIPTPSITQPRSTQQQRPPTISNVPSSTQPLTPINPGLGTETTPNSANLGSSKTPLPKTSSSSDLSKGTAFDTIPQVPEAREYFKKRWEVPPGLTQTLEYILILDTDGTIQRIIPLGQAARIYIDRTGMPLVGTPFVSPIKNGQTPKIRVVLSPDGKVQAFQDLEN